MKREEVAARIYIALEYPIWGEEAFDRLDSRQQETRIENMKTVLDQIEGDKWLEYVKQKDVKDTERNINASVMVVGC